MRALLLAASLGLSALPAIADVNLTNPTDPPLQLAQAQLPPRFGAPPGFHPPPGGNTPTHNGNRPTTGEPNYPGPTNVPPRTNRSSEEQRRMNPTNDPDVQRGIDENDRRMGR